MEDVSEAQIAVHWREEEYYDPPPRIVAELPERVLLVTVSRVLESVKMAPPHVAVLPENVLLLMRAVLVAG